MHIINTLLPVFLIIALGALLRKTKFVSGEFVAGLNQLVFWIGLPCLLFYKIATAEYNYKIAGKATLVMIVGVLCCTVIAYIVAFIIRIPPRAVGTFVQGTFRGNLYYVGLALLIYSFAGADSKMSAQMENIAILVMALLVPVYNIGSIIVLLASQHKLDRYVPLKITRQVITNPLFLACAAGVAYSQIFPPLPLVLIRTLSAVGQISLPLALLGIGAVLAQSKIAGSGIPALAASAIKIGVSPIVGFWAAHLMGLGAGETRIVLLFLACPTAVTSYVVAEQLGGDDKLAAAIIVVSTILSIFSLSVVIGLF
jgi:predicted permease